MLIDDKRKECNIKYAQLLEAIENKKNLSFVHNEIVSLAECLYKFGAISLVDRAKSTQKAEMLIKLAQSINRETKHDDIYFRLTGEHLVNDEELLIEDINNNLELSEEKDEKGEDASNEIRPKFLADYIGQNKIKVQLEELIAAAKIKKQPLEHILLFGSAGLGKTSLSKIIANEMGSRLILLSGPTIVDTQSLVDVIKDVQEDDIVFIDEIHRINQAAAEAIYTVMEDFELSYIKKNSKKESEAITLHLPKFTVIGATTHSGLLEKPMRDRFAIQFKLELYNNEDLAMIANRTINKLGFTIEEDAALEVAKRSRGVPRNCNSFIKRIADRALVKGIDNVDKEFAIEYFELNGIDERGLTELDIDYLNIIYNNYGGNSVGIENISSCLGEGKNIIESQVEPYLLYLGLIKITSKGRALSEKGMQFMQSKEN